MDKIKQFMSFQPTVTVSLREYESLKAVHNALESNTSFVRYRTFGNEYFIHKLDETNLTLRNELAFYKKLSEQLQSAQPTTVIRPWYKRIFSR